MSILTLIAQARTETYTNVMSRYVMFHVQWRFHKMPKSKKKQIPNPNKNNISTKRPKYPGNCSNFAINYYHIGQS